MQLYHHPYSLDSQKVRLALEEKNIDYTSFHLNPITGKNLNSSFFRQNPAGDLPLFQNGSVILTDTVEIIKYIERIALVSSGGGNGSALSDGDIIAWIYRIQQWNSKFFTLSHVPPKCRLLVSKFLRRVIIARMAECPELATLYHSKLKQEYEIEERLRDPEIVRQSEQHLNTILDEAERKLNEKSTYLFGEEFSLADVAFVPVLSRLAILDLEEKYISIRPNVAEYWSVVQRTTYKKVIGKYFHSWRRHRILLKTWFFVQIRSLLKQY